VVNPDLFAGGVCSIYQPPQERLVRPGKCPFKPGTDSEEWWSEKAEIADENESPERRECIGDFGGMVRRVFQAWGLAIPLWA
jgi:hypothetical protein